MWSLWSLQICAWLRLGDHLDYLNIYKQTILPTVDYGCIVWGDCAKNNSQRLERLQNQAMRTILSTNRNTCSQEMRSKLSLLSLESRRRFLRLNLVFKIIHNINCPQQLENYLLKRSAFHTRDFRDSTSKKPGYLLSCVKRKLPQEVTSTSIRKRTCFHSRMLQLKLAILFSELKGEIFGNGKRQE